MAVRMKWDRVAPVRSCTSPDGHSHIDLLEFGSEIPVDCFCTNCGEAFQIVVLPMEEGE